jgi:hypothetical protein
LKQFHKGWLPWVFRDPLRIINRITGNIKE